MSALGQKQTTAAVVKVGHCAINFTRVVDGQTTSLRLNGAADHQNEVARDSYPTRIWSQIRKMCHWIPDNVKFNRDAVPPIPAFNHYEMVPIMTTIEPKTIALPTGN